jgi:hypothetical protein
MRKLSVCKRWADLHKASNIKELQESLDREALVQRTLFPVSRLKNQTRVTCFPELETSRRIFDENFFDEKRVYGYLSKKIYVRVVSTTGQIAHFGQRVSIGLKIQTPSRGSQVRYFKNEVGCLSQRRTHQRIKNR